MANIHEDQKYIVGLLQNNAFVIQSIYEKFAPKVIRYIQQNKGDIQQAEDVIQEALITIYSQAQEKNLQLTCPFDAYFFLLCKRRWLTELKKNHTQWVTIEEEKVSISDDTEMFALESMLFGEKESLFQEGFKALGNACKELLTASFQLRTMEEVAEKLGVTYGYARKKKSLCIGKLTEIIQNSKNFKTLKNKF